MKKLIAGVTVILIMAILVDAYFDQTCPRKMPWRWYYDAR